MEHFSELIVLLGQMLIFFTALLAYLSSKRNSAKIEQVHIAINSRMDEYLKTVAAKSHAEGVKEATEKGEANGAQSRP